MNNKKTILSTRIKELRTELNLTQEELAKKLGLNNKSSIANYESGYSVPSDEIKLKMCKIFDCSMDYLLGRTNIENKEFEIISVNEDFVIKQLIAENYETIKSFNLSYEDIQTLSKQLKITSKDEYIKVLKDCWEILKKIPEDEQDKIINFFIYLFQQKMDRLFLKNYSPSNFYMCPVYGRIAAGQPNWAEECIEGRIPIDPELMNIVNPEECFFLKVNGESMNKVIKNGSFALIRKTDWVEDGEIAVVLVNGYDATLKKFKRLKKSGYIMLEPQSNSDEFEPIIIDPKETEIKIIGKYIGKMEMN